MRIIQKKRAQQYFRRRVVVPTAQQGNTVIELFLISVSSCFNTCIRIGKFLSCIVGIRWVGESSSLPHTVFFWWNGTTAKSLRTTDNYCFLCWACRFPCRPWEVFLRAPRSSLSSKPTFYVLCFDWIGFTAPSPSLRIESLRTRRFWVTYGSRRAMSCCPRSLVFTPPHWNC